MLMMQGFPVSGLREINLLLNLDHENVVPLTEIVVGKHLDRLSLLATPLCKRPASYLGLLVNQVCL